MNKVGHLIITSYGIGFLLQMLPVALGKGPSSPRLEQRPSKVELHPMQSHKRQVNCGYQPIGGWCCLGPRWRKWRESANEDEGHAYRRM